MVSTAYMPFVGIGYYAFGIMGVFYLVEFPFLLSLVHQHTGDGHRQVRSEQATVHAVHAEVSWVCRNGALCVHCISDQINSPTLGGSRVTSKIEWELTVSTAFIF